VEWERGPANQNSSTASELSARLCNQ